MLEVSVIIVSWNAKQHLLNCLSSLSNQSGVVGEIIAVDNGSNDGSSEMVARQFSQVKLIKNGENLGFAKANNIGIRASTGRYVCLINSDVIVLDSCIMNLVEFMDQHPQIGMAGPRILNPDRTLQTSCRHFPSIWNNLCQALGLNYLFPKSAFFSEPFMKYWAHDKARKVDVITGCFWMVRRKAIEEIGLLDEDFFIYGEDIDWCKRFHQASWDVVFYPEAKAIHFGAASAANAPTRFYIEMQKSDLQYWKKYHGRIGQCSYAIIIFIRHLVRLVPLALVYLASPSRRDFVSLRLKHCLACIRWCLKL